MNTRDTVLFPPGEEPTLEDPRGDGPGASRPSRVAPGDRIASMEVMRLLGTGGMGDVWLARDLTLGRKIALKVLRTETLRLDALARREGQTTARFSHAHIVQIYSMGEHEGHPWLALELVDGGSLRDRLRAGPVAALEGARLLRGVADALAHAHSVGVVHMDLKPENVLVGTDGRTRVADFGMARAVDPSKMGLDTATIDSLGGDGGTPRLCGTPPYMAPERFLGARSSAPADIWAFGVLLWEMLRGDRPFDAPGDDLAAVFLRITRLARAPRPDDVPPPLGDLVSACLCPSASERPTAAAIRDALDEFLRPGERDLQGPPFRGLAGFTEAQAGGFYGREEEVTLLAEQLRHQPILPLIGPSGTGKSSLVLGGLVPRLRERTPIWLISVRPGRDPFLTLAHALRADQASRRSGASSPSSALPLPAGPGPGEPGHEEASAAALAQDPFRLGRIVRSRARALGQTAVIFVDQLEELLTVADPEVRTAYLRSVVLAADDPMDPVRVVLTLRDDFLGRLALDNDIARALSRVAVVQPPASAGLHRILEAPVQARGFQWEDQAMVEDLVGATEGLAASLPLLQVAGALLWDRRDRHRRIIPRAALTEIGGLRGALATHADRVLAGLPTPELEVTKQLILRLVTPEETRAVLPLEQLVDALGDSAEPALERLVEHRLVNRRRAEGGASEIELVHEALITHWHHLRRWLDESRSDHRLQSDVEAAAMLWNRQEQSLDGCLSGPQLQRVLDARRAQPLKLSMLAERFVEASVFQAGVQRRRRRLLTGGAAALALIAVVSLIAALLAQGAQVEAKEQLVHVERTRSREVQRQSDRATATLLKMKSSESKRGHEGPAALVQAIAGHAVAQAADDSELQRDLMRAVAAALDGTPGRMDLPADTGPGRIGYVAADPRGEWLAIAQRQDTRLEFFSQRTGETVLRVAQCRSTTRGGVWSPNGDHLAHQCAESFAVRILDRTGTQSQELRCGEGDKGMFRGALAWHEETLFVGGRGGVCAFEGAPLTQTAFYALEGRVIRLEANAKWVAAGVSKAMDGRSGVRVWDRKTGATRLSRPSSGTFLRSILLQDDMLATRSQGTRGQLEVWGLEGEQGVLLQQFGANSWGGGMAFSPDGKWFSAGSAEGIAQWDTEEWRERPNARYRNPQRWEVEMSPDGRRIVATSWDGMMLVIDQRTGEELLRDATFKSRLMLVGFLDEDRVLGWSAAEGAVIWDLSEVPDVVLSVHPPASDSRFSDNRYWWVSEAGDVYTVGRVQADPLRVGNHGKDPKQRVVAASDTWAVTEANGHWWAWDSDGGPRLWRKQVRARASRTAMSPSGDLVALGTDTGGLIVLDRAGEAVFETQIVTPGNVVIDGTNYGSVAPGQLEIQWAPNGGTLVAQHGLSGERWVCRRSPWSCTSVEQKPMQGLVRFSNDSTGFYDRWQDQASTRVELRRFDLPDASPGWSWSDGRIQSSIVSISSGSGRVLATTHGGQLIVVDDEGRTLRVVPSTGRGLGPNAVLPGGQYVAVTDKEAEEAWLWHIDSEAVKQSWRRTGWTYVLRSTSAGPRLWGRIGDRALVPIRVEEPADTESRLHAALGRTNLRVCRASLEVVPVSPKPGPESPWAAKEHCAAEH